MTNKHARALGKLGAKARAAKLGPDRVRELALKASEAAREARARMTPEERSELARRAVRARWDRRK